MFERNSRYDHVELQFSDGISYSSVANEGLKHYGVRPRIILYDDRWDAMELPHLPVQEALVRAFADGMRGKMYDIPSLMLYPLIRTTALPHMYICSEFCEEAICYMDMYFRGLRTPLIKSPTKLADALIEQGYGFSRA